MLYTRNYAVWTLRDALETTSLPPSGTDLDTRIAVACQWLLLAGDEVARLCIFGVEVEPDLLRSYGGGPLYHGPSIFAKGRWMLWKERLRELRVGLCDATQQKVDQTLGQMDVFEEKWVARLDASA